MRIGRLVVLALAVTMVVSGAARAQDDRVTELERKVDALTHEVETLRLGAAPETLAATPLAVLGIGSSAARVYGARGVSVGGYGEMLYENFDHDREDGVAVGLEDRLDLLRTVLYLGYAFEERLHVNTEIEYEHGGIGDEVELQVDPGTGEGETELSGEVVVEFAYVDWLLQRGLGVRAGMLLVPLGLVNEVHEPPTVLTARRPQLEHDLIPGTWSANGIGIYGDFRERLAYRAYLVEGLDAEHFGAEEGFRGGRQGGSQSVLTHPAVTARLDWIGTPGLVIGASAFTGSAWQHAQPGGAFLSPRATLADVHARWQWRGLDARGLFVTGSLTDASDLSDALGLTGSERLGERMEGGYVEASYDVLQHFAPSGRFRLSPYARFERIDTQLDPTGGANDPALDRTIVTAGASFQPHPQVVFKIDREQRSNRAETETPQWNAAVGYSF